ncbi:MAG: glycosyltransferase family 2 protein, partial [Acidimicrobiales bacterium]
MSERLNDRVAVVIITWNALDFTKPCLAALGELTDHPAWRLVVVDNGSTDGTVGWLRDAGVTLIENGENLGYSRAANIGIAVTDP